MPLAHLREGLRRRRDLPRSHGHPDSWAHGRPPVSRRPPRRRQCHRARRAVPRHGHGLQRRRIGPPRIRRRPSASPTGDAGVDEATRRPGSVKGLLRPRPRRLDADVTASPKLRYPALPATTGACGGRLLAGEELGQAWGSKSLWPLLARPLWRVGRRRDARAAPCDAREVVKQSHGSSQATNNIRRDAAHCLVHVVVRRAVQSPHC